MIVSLHGRPRWVNMKDEAARRYVFYTEKMPSTTAALIGGITGVVVAFLTSFLVWPLPEVVAVWQQFVLSLVVCGVGLWTGVAVVKKRRPELALLMARGVIAPQYSTAHQKLREGVESVKRLEAGGYVSKYDLEDVDVDENLISEYLRMTHEDFFLLSCHGEIDWETHDKLKSEVAKVTRDYTRRIRNDVDRKRRDRAVLEAPEREAIADRRERAALTVQARAEQRLNDYHQGLVG